MAIYQGWLPGDGNLLSIAGRMALKSAMQMREGLDLAYRLKGWKLDDRSTMLLPELTESEGLTVGDWVKSKEGVSPYLWGLEPYETDVLDLLQNLSYVLLSFVKIVGSFKHGRVLMGATGCILAPAIDSRRRDHVSNATASPVASPNSGKTLVFLTRTLFRETP